MKPGIPISAWGRVLFAVLVASTLASWTPARAEEERKPWNAPQRYARKKNPVKADAASIRRGRQLFLKHCLSCHGTAGAGDGPAASGLTVHPGNLTDGEKLRKESDGALFFKIRTGRSPMTAFRDTLKKEEIWDVVNYVRTLSAGTVAARESWFKGPAPVLSVDVRAELGTVLTVCLERYEKLRAAVREGDSKAIATEAAAVSKELGRLGELKLESLEKGEPLRTEIGAFERLIAPQLGGIGKSEGNARLQHFSEFSSRLGELLGRYAPSLPEPWTLYLYAGDGEQGSLYWLQKSGEPANPFTPGAAAIVAASYGKGK